LPTGASSDWHIRHSTFQSPTSSSYQNLTHCQALNRQIVGLTDAVLNDGSLS